jgi:hypothetical protein
LTSFRFLNPFGIRRFKNGPTRFSETVGEIFFSASLSPKLRSRAKVRAAMKPAAVDSDDEDNQCN